MIARRQRSSCWLALISCSLADWSWFSGKLVSVCVCVRSPAVPVRRGRETTLLRGLEMLADLLWRWAVPVRLSVPQCHQPLVTSCQKWLIGWKNVEPELSVINVIVVVVWLWALMTHGNLPVGVTWYVLLPWLMASFMYRFQTLLILVMFVVLSFLFISVLLWHESWK